MSKILLVHLDHRSFLTSGSEPLNCSSCFSFQWFELLSECLEGGMVYGTRSIGYTQSVVYVASYRHLLLNGDNVASHYLFFSLQFRQ